MASIRKLVRTDGTKAFKVIYRDKDRDNMQASKTFDNLREATLFKDFLNANNQSLAYARKSVKRLRSKAPKITDILETHFKNLTNIRADTLNKYRLISNRYIIPDLSSIPVDQFTSEEASEWFSNLKVSAKTKKNIQAVLSAAFKTAIKKDVTKNNPILGLKPVREVAKRKPIFLTSQQIKQLIEACTDSYKLLLEFLVVSGLRWGEATALQRKD